MRSPVAVALALTAAPRLAAACSVCGAGPDDKTQGAFVMGSLFLSVLPLALIGGTVWLLVRRARRIAAEEAAGVVRLPAPTARGSQSGPVAGSRPDRSWKAAAGSGGGEARRS